MTATGFTSLGIAGATSVGNKYGDLYNLYSPSTQTPGDTFAGFYTIASADLSYNDLYTQYPRRKQGDPKNAPQTGFYTMQPDGTFDDVNETILMPKFNQLKDASGNIGLGFATTGSQYNPANFVNSIFGFNNNDIYLGGQFETATGASVNWAARWNGSKISKWLSNPSDVGFVNPESLSIPRINVIHGLDPSNIYVGGQFTYYQTTGANQIANTTGIIKWNGSAFISLQVTNMTRWASGTPVFAIFALNPSNIYVGGNFNAWGGATRNNIARYNGTALTVNSMGSGIGASGSTTADQQIIRTIYATDTSNVYVGGTFTTTTLKNIARWNGSAFVAMSTGLNGQVNTIHGANDSSNIYIGGSFTAIQGGVANSLNNIAIWNGTSFTAMDNGLNGSVTKIFAVDQSNVYIGGVVRGEYGDTDKTLGSITKWNGTRFTKLLTALDPSSSKIAYPGFDKTGVSNANVISLFVPVNDMSNVYMAGNISNPNSMAGITFNNIARWGY